MRKYTFEKTYQKIKNGVDCYRKSAAGYLFGAVLQGMAFSFGEKISPYAIPWAFHFHNHSSGH